MNAKPLPGRQPNPTPILLLSLYQLPTNRVALHIQEGEDIMVIEIDHQELHIIKSSFDKLIAILEKKLVWERLPVTGES